MMRIEKSSGWTLTNDMHVSVTHTDAGGTIHTVIRLGGIVLASYLPGTRHLDTAKQVAEQVLTRTLGTLFTEALRAEGVTVVDPGYPTFAYEEPDDDPDWSRQSGE